jgi:threonine aldolase
MKTVDLRSDTVTRPTPAMRAAMAEAPLGDDVFGDDPSVNALQDKVAALLGKEAALFVSSGTQGNLCALMSHCRRGDEALVGQMAHTYRYEAGGAAVFGSIQPQPLPQQPDGTLRLADIEAAIKPDDEHFAPTRLLCLENTWNGHVLAQGYVDAATDLAHTRGLATHLDGARLWNAAVASGISPAQVARGFDSVSVCFSKGLGAPVGSAVTGDAAAIEEARRWRKRLGGGMRQAGIIAAAALHALEHNVDRLAEDHANARLLAGLLDDAVGVRVVRPPVPTNIVLIETAAPAEVVSERAAAEGVLTSVMDRHLLRCMTYLGIDAAAVRRAAGVLRTVLHECAAASPAV